MSAISPNADIRMHDQAVSLGPETDMPPGTKEPSRADLDPVLERPLVSEGAHPALGFRSLRKRVLLSASSFHQLLPEAIAAGGAGR